MSPPVFERDKNVLYDMYCLKDRGISNISHLTHRKRLRSNHETTNLHNFDYEAYK